ncbi:MAG: hypothetical protein RIC30_16745 [Marinoscillum sp.]|uniref:hypothetical protein n=1 Tax=Marinoscillum sp. TaxID=2024838 RepID=UPI0033025BD0
MVIREKIQSMGMFISVVVFLPLLTQAQSEVKIYQDADAYMRQEEYDLAVDAFQYISDLPDVKYKSTISALLSKKYRYRSIDAYLEFEAEKDKDPLYYYWLGKIYLRRNILSIASENLNQFLKMSEGMNKLDSYRQEAQFKLQFVNAAETAYAVTPIESPINSNFAEMSGVLFEDETKLLFASDRLVEGKFDIYLTEKGPYGWNAPKVISQSPVDADHLNLLYVRGTFMYYDQQTNQLHEMEIGANDWKALSKVETLDLAQVQHIYMNKYKTRLIFSKLTVDNGMEIFESLKLRSTGDWMAPVLISPQISSRYNEDYPYLTDDNKRLYFTSDRPGGLGKRDIYYSDFDEVKNVWGPPINAGIPINTVDDDFDFRLSSNDEAVFSSDRIESTGDYDLFVLKLKE